ncbi:MAG: GTPase, partial [Planctomycetota bacterium]
MNAPAFVVVGNVNQGTSSIVAALTEDQGVPIDAMPGTTRTAAEYAFRIGGEVAFRVVDTPGFQRARHALQWLQA